MNAHTCRNAWAAIIQSIQSCGQYRCPAAPACVHAARPCATRPPPLALSKARLAPCLEAVHCSSALPLPPPLLPPLLPPPFLRAMEFTLAILARLQADPAAPLGTVVSETYSSTLMQFHGFFASTAFTVRADCPHRPCPALPCPVLRACVRNRGRGGHPCWQHPVSCLRCGWCALRMGSGRGAVLQRVGEPARCSTAAAAFRSPFPRPPSPSLLTAPPPPAPPPPGACRSPLLAC